MTFDQLIDGPTSYCLSRLEHCHPQAAVRLCDGITEMPYAGSVPHDWNGEILAFLDTWELLRRKAMLKGAPDENWVPYCVDQCKPVDIGEREM